MKTLVIILALFMANLSYAKDDLRENADDNDIRNRKSVYIQIVKNAEKISKEMNLQIIGVNADFIKNGFSLSRPHFQEETVMKIINSANDMSSEAVIVPLFESDAVINSDWHGFWKKPQNSEYVENDNVPILLVKNRENITPLWNSTMLFYEAAKIYSYVKNTEIKYDRESGIIGKYYACLTQFAIMDYYGKNGYKEYIEKKAEYIQGLMINDEEVFLFEPSESKEIEKFFGASFSPEEKVFKQISVWARSVFLAIDKISPDPIQGFSQKKNFLLFCEKNKMLN